jgi:hypothetical protein
MPSIETDCRHQKAVYWAASGTDIEGEVTLAAAVELSVRWENTDTQVLDAQGNPVAISAVVVVDRDIPVGSIFWEGKQSALPSPVTDLLRVEEFKSIPDVKGRNSRKTVLLSKYSDTLPDLA